jgi:hypothetical protein
MKQILINITLIILLALLPIGYCTAVEPNPTLALRLELASKKFTDALQTQRNRQLMVGEGHVFIGREVQALNELQREYNDYLDQFHDAVSTAAELYGIFLEIKRTVKLSMQVTDIISDAPTNAIAVMLKPNTSGLYGSILQTSLGAAQDIYNACISKKKLTAQDRNKMLTNARTKIKKVNSDLTKLVIVLRYTTLEDIWYTLRTRAKYMDKERKHAVIERCYDNWKHNIR